MSRYYVDKFLYTVDRDPELLKRYTEDPQSLVTWWEEHLGPKLNDVERTTVLALTSDEREALIRHDYVALFEMGAHFFLSLTIFIGIYNDEWMETKGPLSFQREFAARLSHWVGRDYPSVATCPEFKVSKSDVAEGLPAR